MPSLWTRRLNLLTSSSSAKFLLWWIMSHWLHCTALHWNLKLERSLRTQHEKPQRVELSGVEWSGGRESEGQQTHTYMQKGLRLYNVLQYVGFDHLQLTKSEHNLAMMYWQLFITTTTTIEYYYYYPRPKWKVCCM